MFIKRVIAYVIDMIIVLLAASMLASISYINPKLDAENKIYEEFEQTVNDYTDGKIEQEEYNEKIIHYNYEIDRNSVISTIISIALVIAYFAFFQKYNGGATFGKKIMKIKIVENVSIFHYLLRTIILYNVIYNCLKIIFVLTVNESQYAVISNVLYVLFLIFEVSNIITITARKDGRGIHDLIAKTSVQLVDNRGDK